MLYHYQVYMPKNVSVPQGLFLLNYSTHAQQAANNDRYGRINLPRILDTRKAQIIELEINNNTITKVVYRIEYDTNKSLILVVIPQNALVKTVWLNEKNDNHKTLNVNRYARG